MAMKLGGLKRNENLFRPTNLGLIKGDPNRLIVSLGASIIEKHFTLSKKINSVDNFFSADEKDFKRIIQNCKKIVICKGKNFYGPTLSEKKSLKYRRSIYVSKKIMNKGMVI